MKYTVTYKYRSPLDWHHWIECSKPTDLTGLAEILRRIEETPEKRVLLSVVPNF